jgi:hypothetical protein
MNKENILMDRTFDAACMKKAGEVDFSNMIMNRLKAKYPNDLDRINQLYEFYCSTSGEYFDVRIKYMLEHKDRLKLRYK